MARRGGEGHAEKFDKFFKEHGHCLKEGVASDWSHREAIAKLLRFESSFTEAGKTTTLTDYVSRMPEGQKEIYYLLAPSREAAEASPYFEVFREKKFEVLFLTDPRDEFVMEHLREFDKKRVVAAEKADLALDDKEHALSDDEARLLANLIKEQLGDRVDEVRTSKRLVGSPAVVVDSDPTMTASMRRVLKMMNREGAPGLESKPNLEINPDHPMMVRLTPSARPTPRWPAKSQQIFDNALVAAGLLEDPRAMLARPQLAARTGALQVVATEVVARRLTRRRGAGQTDFCAGNPAGHPNQPSPMKMNPLFALLAAASLGLVGCEKSPTEKAAEEKADAMEKQADAVEKSAKDQAAEIKKEAKEEAKDIKADAAADADTIKKAGDQAADALEKKADAVRDAAKDPAAPAPPQ